MKFSDSPHFLLKDYFDTIMAVPTETEFESELLWNYFYDVNGIFDFYNTNTFNWDFWTEETHISVNSYLRGRGLGIVVNSYWTDLYINTDTEGLVPHKFRSFPDQEHIEGNFFKFIHGGTITIHQNLVKNSSGILTPTDNVEEIESGSDVYFRKDSLFHKYLITQTEYSTFFNENKTWLYFGKIYRIEDTSRYTIEFKGLKDFSLAALPPNNRTPGMEEWLNVYFDRVYHQTYNRQKNMKCLTDAKEININWLDYMAKMYKMTVNSDLSERAQRDWVQSLIGLLKRKGTYTSLYIPWKVLGGYSSNKLNIYERWNDFSLSGSPEPYFTDSLYTHSYDVTGGIGPAGNEYYADSFGLNPNNVHYQYREDNYWPIIHNMETINTLTHCYDLYWNRIWEIGTSISSNYKIYNFSPDLYAGTAYTAKSSDYNFIDIKNAVDWHIANTYSTSGSNDVSNWSLATSGYTTSAGGLVPNIECVYVWSPSGAPSGATLDSTSWIIDHNLNTKRLFVFFYDTGNDSWLTDGTYSYALSGDNQIRASFTLPTSGWAVISEVKSDISNPLPEYSYPDGMMLSPHYKVEIDLSSEPMDENEIITEELMNNLITEWDNLKPVSRYSSYQLLLSPVTDWSGEWKETLNHTNSLHTKYCKDPVYISTGDEDAIIYQQRINSSKWIINHSYNTKDLYIACYGIDNKEIYPNNIIIRTNSTIEITFEKPIAGDAYICNNNYVINQENASTWISTHIYYNKEVLSQYYDENYIKLLPSNILVEPNQVTATFSEMVSGKSIIVGADRIHKQEIASKIWTIAHNFGKPGLVAQFFDTSGNLIFPSSITLEGSRICTAVFDKAVAGSAVIKSVKETFTSTTFITDLLQGAKWRIGNGGGTTFDPMSPTRSNEIDSEIEEGTGCTFAEDEDYNYITFEVTNTDEMNISEFAILTDSDYMIFYSKFNNIYKPENVTFKVHLRVERDK